MKIARLLFLLLFLSHTSKAFDCFDMAGRDYHIEADLLRSIWFRESSFRLDAINYVSAENFALGAMQIHSQNLPHLAQYGITPQKLLSDPCMNVYTGAYYLAIAFQRWGYNWRAVGAYNAGFSDKPEQEKKRQKYANEIKEIYMKMYAGKNRIPSP